jgi:hypothetical protein
VFLCVPVMHAFGAQEWEPNRRWRHRDGVQVRVGRNYHLPADQIASWPVVVVGGSATIEGRVEDDIVVIGGPVHIGPAAQVRANIVSIGGEVQVADTAEVSGEIHDISVLWPEIQFALRDWLWGIDRGWWAAFRLTGTIFRYTLTLLAACLLALVAPRWIRRIQDRVVDAPLGAGFVGLASEILMLPMFLIVVGGLILTIVGIPLLILVPFAALALLVSWVAGFASVAAQLGSRFRMRSRIATPDTPILDVAWGVTLLFLLPLASDLIAIGSPFTCPLKSALGLAGIVLEYLSWTVGLGAVLLAPLHRRWQVGPPPVPSAATPGFGTTTA